MSPAYWQKYLETRQELIRSSLSTKAAEYASGGDRMHNFNRTYIAAAGKCRHREDAMFGMMLKHWTSILDMIDALGEGTLPKEALVKEKFGDMINYLLLMEGSILHKIDTKNGCEVDFGYSVAYQWEQKREKALERGTQIHLTADEHIDGPSSSTPAIDEALHPEEYCQGVGTCIEPRCHCYEDAVAKKQVNI